MAKQIRTYNIIFIFKSKLNWKLDVVTVAK